MKIFMTILSIRFRGGHIDIDYFWYIDSSCVFFLRNYVCLHLSAISTMNDSTKTRKTFARIATSFFLQPKVIFKNLLVLYDCWKRYLQKLNATSISRNNHSYLYYNYSNFSIISYQNFCVISILCLVNNQW